MSLPLKDSRQIVSEAKTTDSYLMFSENKKKAISGAAVLFFPVFKEL